MKLKYVSVEKMKYKNDSLAYLLILLGLVVNVVYFVIFYEVNNQFLYSIKIGISVLYNLIFLLSVFLSAENIKKYNRKYAVFTCIIGLMQFVRIFAYLSEVNAAGVFAGNKHMVLVILLIISGVLLILGSIVSIVNSTILKSFVEGKLKLDSAE